MIIGMIEEHSSAMMARISEKELLPSIPSKVELQGQRRMLCIFAGEGRGMVSKAEYGAL